MSSEQRMYSLEYRLFAANYFHIVYMAMKKCYYEGPLLNFEGGHGSRVLGARVPGPGSWSHFYTMPLIKFDRIFSLHILSLFARP